MAEAAEMGKGTGAGSCSQEGPMWGSRPRQRRGRAGQGEAAERGRVPVHSPARGQPSMAASILFS